MSVSSNTTRVKCPKAFTFPILMEGENTGKIYLFTDKAICICVASPTDMNIGEINTCADVYADCYTVFSGHITLRNSKPSSDD